MFETTAVALLLTTSFLPATTQDQPERIPLAVVARASPGDEGVLSENQIRNTAIAQLRRALPEIGLEDDAPVKLVVSFRCYDVGEVFALRGSIIWCFHEQEIEISGFSGSPFARSGSLVFWETFSNLATGRGPSSVLETLRSQLAGAYDSLGAAWASLPDDERLCWLEYVNRRPLEIALSSPLCLPGSRR